MMPDAARLERILAALDAPDALWLSQQLEPAWQARQRRLAARDEALCAAGALFEEERSTVRAKRLARALSHFAETDWTRPPSDGLQTAMQLVLELNDGRPARWGTVHAAFQKTPVATETTERDSSVEGALHASCPPQDHAP